MISIFVVFYRTRGSPGSHSSVGGSCWGVWNAFAWGVVLSQEDVKSKREWWISTE